MSGQLMTAPITRHYVDIVTAAGVESLPEMPKEDVAMALGYPAE